MSVTFEDSDRGAAPMDMNLDKPSVAVVMQMETGNPLTEIDGLLQYDDDGRLARTGTMWSASAHIITAIIGSGVLSLAWAMAQMGWIGGPIAILSFGGVSYYTSILLADCYRTPDPITGKRNPTYMQAVKAFLGRRHVIACGILQYTGLFGTMVGYTITSAHSLLAMVQADCYHKKGHEAHCPSTLSFYIVGFGVMQILFSQIPNFDQLWWLSIVAAVMSILYSSIGFGLGLAKAIGNGYIKGTLFGISVGTQISEYTTAKKTYQIFGALGDIAFAFGFSSVLNNIQDTLKTPPAENKTMKEATLIATLITTLSYLSVGSAGYAAFGNDAPGDLLTGFGFFEPSWLVIIANICIVIHLVGAYQVFSQPLFSFLEEWTIKKFGPHNKFIETKYRVGPYTVTPLRLVLRTTLVFLSTILGLLVPFFNAVMGLLGAIAFWPLTIYFPVKMYSKQMNLNMNNKEWWCLQCISVICFLVTIAATLGSMEDIITNARQYKSF